MTLAHGAGDANRQLAVESGQLTPPSIPSVARGQSRRRVDARIMVVPPATFELASDLWEPPDASECEQRDVRFIGTDALPASVRRP